MAPHSSTLAWKIPWTEEPGRLQSLGSLKVRHDWATSLSLFTFMHWRRKWQPTPVFWPGESQGRGSLVGCRLWGHTELDRTEATSQQQQQQRCINVNPNFPIHPTPSFPLCHPYVCSIHLCLYVCFANKFICSIFLDFTFFISQISTVLNTDPVLWK